MTKYEILATNLTLSGYGSDYATIINILSKLSEDDIDKLTYNLYRTAEKIGLDAFDCTDVYDDTL